MVANSDYGWPVKLILRSFDFEFNDEVAFVKSFKEQESFKNVFNTSKGQTR